MTQTIPSRSLDIAGLETVYDTLANAIDQAGPDKAELFLVKLALLNAHALGDEGVFRQLTETALQDL
jgi:hypothetical protein